MVQFFELTGTYKDGYGLSFQIAVSLLIVSDYLKELLTVYGTDENPIFKALNILLGMYVAPLVFQPLLNLSFVETRYTIRSLIWMRRGPVPQFQP